MLEALAGRLSSHLTKLGPVRSFISRRLVSLPLGNLKQTEIQEVSRTSRTFSTHSVTYYYSNNTSASDPAMADTKPNPQYLIPNSTEVCLLDCKVAFKGLSPRQQRYAHHLAQAAFTGGLVVLFQTSPESPGIFLLLQKLFTAQSPEELAEVARGLGWSDQEVQAFYIYAAAFYSNMGNYKSFGDTKFVPDVDQDKLGQLIEASAAHAGDSECIDRLWAAVRGGMFSLDPRARELGLAPKGTTTYFSSNCDENDAKLAQQFMDEKNLSAYNTRLFKTEQAGTGPSYEVRLASAETGDTAELPLLGKHDFSASGTQAKFEVTRGDYAPLMALVCGHLEEAKREAENEHERAMLQGYVRSFSSGSLDAHKDGSRHWIKNKGPIVETYIGFIESYRDPYGVRGEFEGFVAVVNKEMSAKFEALVASAEKLLPELPWPSQYEKDRFLQPDFTSLDVLAFGGSGIPAGINIPNYDDIRQDEGFKNVSLGNVLTAGYKDSKVTFLKDDDVAVYSKFKVPSFEVQVGLHELLGHGSGKLFQEDKDGKKNFDPTVTDPLTGEQICQWYGPGETWDSKFSSIASTYEECRAECVGIYLCLLPQVLDIFGHGGESGGDIVYVNWLNMVRAGLLALEFYSPETKSWRQAHMNARYVILRVLLEAGEGLVRVEATTGEDGRPDALICLDRDKIHSVGKPAIGAFLQRLQVYKATGDIEAGSKMYSKYSEVCDLGWPKFLSLRDVVLARKQPRKLFVQHHTEITEDEVTLQEFPPSAGGLVQSFVSRVPPPATQAVSTLWEAL